MECNNNVGSSLNLKHSFMRNFLVFLIGSAIGIFIFFVPAFNGKMPFEILQKTLVINPLGDKVPYVIIGIVAFNLFGYIYGKTLAREGSYFNKKFANNSKIKGLNYFLAFVFVIMALTQKGIPFLYHETTVPYMIREIFPFTIGCLTVGGLVLPLLTSYGILELAGVMLEPIMRPVLKLPGKAAIDSLASIVGAAVVGIFLTTSLYHDNQYTDKEALSIASGFSLNSVGYCAFLVSYVGLSARFNSMFLIYLLIAYIIAAIIVRIPPICRHSDTYENGAIQTEEMRRENKKFTKGQFRRGFVKAIEKADTSDNVVKDLIFGAFNGFMVVVEIIPMMVVIGGLMLAVYNFTPIIQIASRPLIPLISLVGVPEAALAAESIFLGGIELFMPSIAVTAGTANEAVRYFVVMVSMVQVLYITETMLPLISFGLPVKFWELIVIWLERTLIAIPLVAIAMHLVF
ncbi:nucleoside recognition domain-containing protein [Proteiniborus sp. MB09-C3]|uniref:YjiH family protein n=1 Tax=Proteiniborus sp. MB09-C3 TaxID=3050072 RepID=UPI002553005D|nr:nucleoside recognition domain-containing protein [Proteiniborus sp. MB09-C3]WIV13059.1 nucleoside recognition domain-containing protein [Proteiniborus sp. MB09-C3]